MMTFMVPCSRNGTSIFDRLGDSFQELMLRSRFRMLEGFLLYYGSNPFFFPVVSVACSCACSRRIGVGEKVWICK